MSEPVGSSSTPTDHTKNPAGNKRKDPDTSSVPPSPKRPFIDLVSSGSNEETKDTASSVQPPPKPQQQQPPPPPPPQQQQQQEDVAMHEDPISSDSDGPQPEDGIQLVELPDDVVYQELEQYEVNNGRNPVESPYHMQMFCDLYIRARIGNQRGWEAKIQRLRDKFKDLSEESVPFDEMGEFILWKKMFNRPVPDDAGSRNLP